MIRRTSPLVAASIGLVSAVGAVFLPEAGAVVVLAAGAIVAPLAFVKPRSAWDLLHPLIFTSWVLMAYTIGGALSHPSSSRAIYVSLVAGGVMVAVVLAATIIPTSTLRFELAPTSSVSLGWEPVRFAALVLAVLGLLLYIGYVAEVGGPASLLGASRIDRFLAVRGLGPLVSGLYLVNFAWFLLLANALLTEVDERRRRRVIGANVAAVSLVSALWMLTFGDRRVVVSLILGVSFVILSLARVSILRGVLVGSVIVGVVVRVGAARFAGSPGDVIRVASGDILNLGGAGEFMSPFTAWLFVSEGGLSESLRFGWTYVLGVLATTPSFLWSSRPTALSNEYAQAANPVLFQRGGGLGFGYAAEATLNFGRIGPVVAGLLLGVALAFITRSTKRVLASTSRVWGLAGYAGVLGAILVLPRGDTTSVVQQLLVGFVIPLALAKLAVILYWSVRLVRLNRDVERTKLDVGAAETSRDRP